MPAAPKAPAFQFYCRDWISSGSVTLMSMAAEATYLRLLCYQWLADDGLLPADHVALRAMTKCTPAEWRRVWPELEPHFPIVADGKRGNLRILEDRRQRDAFRDEQRAKAAKGNRSRWGAEDGSPSGRNGDHPAIPGAVAEPSPDGSPEGSPDDRSAVCSLQSAVEHNSTAPAREAVSRNETTRERSAAERLTPHGARCLEHILRAHPAPAAFEAEVAAVLEGMRPNVPTDPEVVSQALSDLLVAGGQMSARSFRAFVQGAARERAKATAAPVGDDADAVIARSFAKAEAELRAQQQGAA